MSVGVSGPDDEQRALVAAALAHETAGRYDDALRGLTEAFARDPAPEVADHIVRVRHAAASKVSARSAADWPPARPDPFPDHRGAPEIHRPDLTASLLGGAILHHGCLIVRGLVPRDAAVGVREMVTRSIDARDRIVENAPQPGDEHWYRRFLPADFEAGRERHWIKRTGGMLMTDSPMVLCAVLDAYERAGVLEVIAEHLG